MCFRDLLFFLGGARTSNVLSTFSDGCAFIFYVCKTSGQDMVISEHLFFERVPIFPLKIIYLNCSLFLLSAIGEFMHL